MKIGAGNELKKFYDKIKRILSVGFAKFFFCFKFCEKCGEKVKDPSAIFSWNIIVGHHRVIS